LDFDLVRDRANRVFTTRRPQHAGHEQTQAKVKAKGEGEGETTKRVEQEKNLSPEKNAAAEKARHEQHAGDADAHEFTIAESAGISGKDGPEYAHALGHSQRVTAYPHAGDADAHEFTIAKSAGSPGKDGPEYAHALGHSQRVTAYPYAGHADAGDYACCPHLISREDGHEHADAVSKS
jgi:hypothetical protein